MLFLPHLLEKSSKSKRIIGSPFSKEFKSFCGLEGIVDAVNRSIMEYNVVGSFKISLSDVIIDYQHRVLVGGLDTSSTLQALVTSSTCSFSFSLHSS